MKTRSQATRCNRAGVLLHISRQRNLGERMLGDRDQPKPFELLVCAVLVLTVLFCNARGYL